MFKMFIPMKIIYKYFFFLKLMVITKELNMVTVWKYVKMLKKISGSEFIIKIRSNLCTNIFDINEFPIDIEKNLHKWPTFRSFTWHSSNRKVSISPQTTVPALTVWMNDWLTERHESNCTLNCIVVWLFSRLWGVVLLLFVTRFDLAHKPGIFSHL